MPYVHSIHPVKRCIRSGQTQVQIVDEPKWKTLFRNYGAVADKY